MSAHSLGGILAWPSPCVSRVSCVNPIIQEESYLFSADGFLKGGGWSIQAMGRFARQVGRNHFIDQPVPPPRGAPRLLRISPGRDGRANSGHVQRRPISPAPLPYSESLSFTFKYIIIDAIIGIPVRRHHRSEAGVAWCAFIVGRDRDSALVAAPWITSRGFLGSGRHAWNCCGIGATSLPRCVRR